MENMKINNLKRFFCTGLSLLAIMVCLNVKAEGLDQSKTVTVGDVDTPIYSVDIIWRNLSYDWKYNPYTNDYGFKVSFACLGYTYSGYSSNLDNLKQQGRLYSNSSCTEGVTGDLVEGTTYYANNEVGGGISVIDNSENGRINARAQFVPSYGYEWVVGKFANGYAYNDDGTIIYGGDEIIQNAESLHLGEIMYGEDSEDGTLFDSLSISNVKRAYMHLEKNPNIIKANTITSGDTIGTVTILITPDID